MTSALADLRPLPADCFVGRIPVRNIWLLLFYASELFRIRGPAKVNLEERPDELPDLVGELLAPAVEKRQRRGLSLGYRTRSASLNRVRGRIDVLTTERHQLLERGLIHCKFDELTIDTTRKRYIRAALEVLSRLVQNSRLAHRCRSLAASLKSLGVSGIVPTRAEISLDRFGRNDAQDQEMMAAAKLAFDLALPTEVAGTTAMPLPDREAQWVWRLFEKAVGGFYEVALSSSAWNVYRGTSLTWHIEQKTSGIDHILPNMRTDIILENAPRARRIIIDTKFTTMFHPGWYQDETLRSAHIYQIYAYLRSQSGIGDPLADTASGVLLHPAVGELIDENVTIQSHNIRFATVDLAATPQVFRSQLLRICEELPSNIYEEK